jgi:hypothetical protein
MEEEEEEEEEGGGGNVFSYKTTITKSWISFSA